MSLQTTVLKPNYVLVGVLNDRVLFDVAKEP